LGVRPPRAERRFPEFGRIPEPPAAEEDAPLLENPGRENPGLLGVRAVPLSQSMVRILRSPVARGAVVVAVVEGSAADQASLPRSAIIVAVDNRAIDSPEDLARRVQLAGAGAQIELAYYYNGQLIRKQVTLAGPNAEPPAAEPPGTVPEIRPPAAATRSLEQRVEQLEAEVRELRRLLESR
jgi:predicted metalloprotease with PDZ domain